MPYTNTQGQTGNGTTIEINTASVATPTWVLVGESVDITPSGFQNKTDDGTNLQSSAIERVFTIADGGTWKVTGNRVSADAGQTAVKAARASGAATQFRVTLPKTPAQMANGDRYTFLAIVEEYSPTVKVDKITKFAMSLATTNGITETAGT